jgi:hypothetical protein
VQTAVIWKQKICGLQIRQGCKCNQTNNEKEYSIYFVMAECTYWYIDTLFSTVVRHFFKRRDSVVCLCDVYSNDANCNYSNYRVLRDVLGGGGRRIERKVNTYEVHPRQKKSDHLHMTCI